MKRFSKYKLVQLVIYIFISGGTVALILTNEALTELIRLYPVLGVLCGVFWFAMCMAFLFLFLDYSFYNGLKRDAQELEYASQAQVEISTRPNRFSSENITEKFQGIPISSDVGCIILDISNLQQVSGTCGRKASDELVLKFEQILGRASRGLCSIGRNCDNKFLAIFEDCDEEKMNSFLSIVTTRVNNHNMTPKTIPITFHCGVAFQEPEQSTLSDLIKTALNRMQAD